MPPLSEGQREEQMWKGRSQVLLCMSTCNIQVDEPGGNMSWTCEFGAWREAKLVIEVCELSASVFIS